MNIAFITQAGSLRLFHQLRQHMAEKTSLDKCGFYLTDSRFYKSFREDTPDIDEYPLLKEWEIVRRGVDENSFDVKLLRELERKYGNPCLWNAIVADRRIFFGPKYAFDQDYRSRYSHETMLSILQTGITMMEDFFDRVQPDCVVIFQCMTIGDYLSSIIAHHRGIQVINMRPTRVANFFYGIEHVLEPSERLLATYESLRSESGDTEEKKQARDFIERSRTGNFKYEGVVSVSSKPPSSGAKLLKLLNPITFIEKLAQNLVKEWRWRFTEERHDNHIPGYLAPVWAKRVTRPCRAWLMERRFKNQYVRDSHLDDLDYAFLPLHPEPEITLQVYSKPYMNQIEAARLIALNLPVGMKLVAKEHPWQIGKRPLSYYQKLTSIPNAVLAHPGMTTKNLVEKAALVTVIAGSTGFEALMKKRPVILLGRAPFAFLPDTMIRHASNPDQVGFEIRDLLAHHAHDEEALISYVAAIIKEGVPIDFYSRLLKRKEAHNPDESTLNDENVTAEHYRRLAKYVIGRTNQSK